MYTYPDSGIVFVRTLYVDTVSGDSSSRKLLETRFLLNKGHDWYYFNYRWNEDQTDAYRIMGYAEDTIFTVMHSGETIERKWRYGGYSECINCHTRERRVNGFFTANLNRPSIPEPAKNQIQYLFEAGVFLGNQPPDYNSIPRWIWEQSSTDSARLDTMARAYVGTRCSPCHYPGGGEAGLDFTYYHMRRDQQDLFSGGGSISRCYNTSLVYPGDPDASRLYSRQLEPSMPPVPGFVPDSAGFRVIHDWICNFDTAWCHAPPQSLKVHGVLDGIDTTVIVRSDIYDYKRNRAADTVIITLLSDTMQVDTLFFDTTFENIGGNKYNEKCPVIELVPWPW
jgi:hypothetical protein